MSLKGKEGFGEYYSSIYKERWAALRESLSREREPVSFSEGLTTPYFLDEASIEAARLLPVKSGDRVLDMCAAPGGKTLVIASEAEEVYITANDRSSARRARLKTVIETHLTAEKAARITVTGHDANRWGLFEKDVYDAVLLDAPCSSERHVISDPKALAEWSEQRPKRLAVQQFAMLCAALDAAKKDGYILYSTCSIAPEENEGVIAKLFRKRSGRFDIIKIENPAFEKLSFGGIILPDTSNLGPIYACLIRKIV